MSWIEVKDINNKKHVIPESVFKSYEDYGVFKRVETPKETVKPKTIKSEVEDGNSEIQLTEQTEVGYSRKSSKKAQV